MTECRLVMTVDDRCASNVGGWESSELSADGAAANAVAVDTRKSLARAQCPRVLYHLQGKRIN